VAERVPSEVRGLRLQGEAWFIAGALPFIERACRERRHGAGVVEEAQVRAHFKFSPLRGRSSLRHGLRSLWPGVEVPRLQEFANLTWLRDNGFRAPRPLVAGCVRSAWGLPVFQLLFTEEVPGASTLRQLFEAGPAPLRRRALEELAREVARLHGHGFVHRDLFPRNLLVTEEGDAVRVHFLDVWRGGPRPGLRGPAYDLACLMLFGVDLFDAPEQEAFLTTYFDARNRLGQRVQQERFLRAAVRQRRALRERLLRERGRGSTLPLPSLEWTP